jgi:nitric oxide reductase NorQ protein
MNSNVQSKDVRNSRPYYQFIGNEGDIFKTCHQTKLPILLKGPTGCGKSRFVDAIAFDLGVSLITVSCNEDTTASDLIGRFLIKGNETVWQDGPLTRAIRTGAILYLDEVIEAREDVIVLIHSLTDYRRSLYIDALSEEIKAPDSFQLVVSYNPGYQKSFKELKPSTRQRFVALEFNYPKPEVEVEIISKETGINESLSKKLVALGNKIRSLNELGLSESVSTRLLVNSAHLIASGLSPRLACEVGMANCLTDEQDIAKAIRDIVNLYI